jgi:spore germination cell wall hydrolase CwlJ-like protein
MSEFGEGFTVRTLYGEARGEPDIGRRAVAHVILNRLADGRWGQTLAAVCDAWEQFSCWNPHDPNRKRLLAMADDDPALVPFAAVFAAAQAEPDFTNGAMWYYAESIPAAPDWAAAALPCGGFGTQLFFKGVT